MNAKRFVFPLLSALFLGLGSPTRAWGPVGHKAVAMIAQSRLSPLARRGIEAILGPGVDLQKIANCPDAFDFNPDAPERECAGIFTISGDPAATKPWHYIGVPLSASVDAASLMSYCPQDDCVVGQIPKDVAVLKDPAASLQDKRTALMYLVHFAGDVHQPLHAVRDGHDYGGNLEIMHAVVYQGKPLNLHAVWDYAIEDPAKVAYGLPEDALTAQAETLARTLEAGLPDAAPGTAAELAATAALESHVLDASVIFPAYQASRGDDALADYQPRMRPIAYRRIQLAGARLAAMLEQAFAADVSPAP